jgi:probable rRNA maturation factor
VSAKVNIFNETEVKFLPVKKLKQIVENCLSSEKADFSTINLIFLDDAAMQKMNKEYLNHDFTTDVISFNLDAEDENQKIGEIYISLDTAKEQANEYKVSLSNELLRLAAHGTLHICGYEDSTKDEKDLMHSKEDELISRMKNS